MTTASATPQQMRDRLLQAIDSHSNQICNMVAVLEVITYLEKFPITKEALEETRLGKLINDVRKQTKDEDLAKRAKKLLRSWQKLIEPGQNETPSRGAVCVPGSANGSAHPFRTDIPPPDVSMASKGVPEVKTRNDVHNTHSPKAEKSSSRKRRGEQRDSVHLAAKISNLSPYEQMYNTPPPPPTNGIAGSPEAPPSPDRARTEHLENDKHSRIPVNAVKPHPSSPGLTKLPSTSSLLKTAVLQQQARLDEGGGGQYQAKSPHCLSSSLRSPRTMKQETMSKRSSTYAPKGTIPSPARSPRLLSSQSLKSPAEVSHVDGLPPPAHRASLHWPGSSEVTSHPPRNAATLEPPPVFPPTSQPAPTNSESSELQRPTPSSSVVVVKAEAEVAASSSDRKKRKKYRSRDYSVNLQGQDTEDQTRPVRLKERRLTFDPVTGQIKSMVHKELSQVEEPPRPPPPEPQQRTHLPLQQHPAPTPSPFQQTNWKELSRNDIIQSYLNLQSNVLTSSGVQAPGAHFFMSEYLKREESDVREARRGVHVLQLDSSVTDTPGVSRELTDEDLHRVHMEHWQGVNGCCDTKGTWYDWTECISLDPHGDESKLNILPYVCLD
ncbi:mediator of RNA polymerase II transcription subunit 26-like isoform X1 [Salvelinus namaycush]|uniref:Mediator of RNA polymerase II transcription subunit 26 n=1 Tax=Salvelinus namaycush TaxID=8040 RepID=A0A8U0P874_SALNM|nr:mediator of RNA polymerase II transcription subunit 26-like isoform X1 [Salvelinus namaycush]